VMMRLGPKSWWKLAIPVQVEQPTTLNGK